MSNTFYRPSARGLIAHSPRMRELLKDVERAAALPGGVVLSGEPGSGRGIVARAIHAGAHEQGAPFVEVYCNKASHSQLELELFGTTSSGSRSGAGIPATGAARQSRQRIAPGSLLLRARGGTIYFSHLDRLPDRVQARLVHLLDDREAIVGAKTEPEPFIVRPMTALDAGQPSEEIGRLSDQDPKQIRPDLLKRLSTFRITVPPLRERREDIPELANFFLSRACRQRNVAPKRFVPEASAVLAALPWYANASEMRDLIDLLVLTTPHGTDITLDAVMAHVRLETPKAGADAPALRPTAGTLRQARLQFERDYIAAALARHRGHVAETARALGMQRTNLYRKLRSLHLLKSQKAITLGQ